MYWAEFYYSGFIKRYKALISGMTDFAHLNDINDTIEVLIDHFLVKSETALLFFPQTWDTKSRFPNLVQLRLKLKHRRKEWSTAEKQTY